MIGEINIAEPADILRSDNIALELKGPDLSGPDKVELQAEQNRITLNVKIRIIDEVLSDINSMFKILKGSLIKKSVERYTLDIENKQMSERFGWHLTTVQGQRRQFDPTLDPPVYQKIPMIKVERTRDIFVCSTNRKATEAVEDILMEFLERLRHGFKNATVAEIMAEKKTIEDKISRIDLAKKVKESFTEAEFLEFQWISRPMRTAPAASPSGDDLFKRFDALQKAGVL